MSKLPSHDMVRRIEDAAAALIAAGTPNPTNVQVRNHLGSGSLATISPVMRAFRARQRELAREEPLPLPPELEQLLTGQLSLLWQASVQQAEAGALAKVAELESELAVLREVRAERDRLRQQEQTLQEQMILLREEVMRQQTRSEHLNEQLQESREEVKTLRASEKALQKELLMQARAEPKGVRGTK
ncbi:DNA-binding protein [Escherichia coli]|nr:DNA-binding protein [Escherichia coli]